MTQLRKAFDKQQELGRKPGNTAWCQCGSCEDWFHLGPSILAAPDLLLHCPHCHEDFVIDNAKQIILPDNK